MWNRSNTRYTRRSELDLNFSNGTAFDLDEEYLNSSGDDTLPASPEDLNPAESPPSYDTNYVPGTPVQPSAVAQLPVVDDATLASVVAERGFWIYLFCDSCHMCPLPSLQDIPIINKYEIRFPIPSFLFPFLPSIVVLN